QVHYMLSSMKTLAAEKNVVIDVINTMHYGIMNGEAV
ncbi:PTS sugar transporter subunit IIB, partial [Bacillus nitratireducens]|nr:PTS sugar transporter subunit IIB [Bacillus nitratireducens]